MYAAPTITRTRMKTPAAVQPAAMRAFRRLQWRHQSPLRGTRPFPPRPPFPRPPFPPRPRRTLAPPFFLCARPPAVPAPAAVPPAAVPAPAATAPIGAVAVTSRTIPDALIRWLPLTSRAAARCCIRPVLAGRAVTTGGGGASAEAGGDPVPGAHASAAAPGAARARTARAGAAGTGGALRACPGTAWLLPVGGTRS